MPIPKFREDGWLPDGHHDASWEEIVERFDGLPNSQRARVMQRLLEWRDQARAKRISGRLILNGSFISSKKNPNDFDAIFLYDDAVGNLLEQDAEAKGLLDYMNCKNAGFDMLAFPGAIALQNPKWVHLDAFDRDKVTNILKGVLEVRL